MNPIDTAQNELQVVVNTLLISPVTDDVDQQYSAAKDRISNAVQALEKFAHDHTTLHNAAVNQRTKIYNIREWFNDPSTPVYSDVLATRLRQIIADLGHINTAVRLYGSGMDVFGDPVEGVQ